MTPGHWLTEAAAQADALVPWLKDRGEIQRGLAAAEAVTGLIIADDDKDAEVADLALSMREAEKLVTERQQEITGPLRQLDERVRDTVRPLLARLKAGKQAANDAHTRWVIEKQRRAAAEAERQRIEAAHQAAAHAEEDPDAPMAEVVVPKVETNARGGSAVMHVRRVLKCELADPHECPPEWLGLREAQAKEAHRAAVTLGEVAEPQPGGARARWRGVDFWVELDSSGRAK